MKRIVALICSIVLILPIFSSVAADDGLGKVYMVSEETLADGLKYSEIYAENQDGRQKGYTFTYTLGGDTDIIIGTGGFLYGRKTATEIAVYESSAGKNILGSVNGNTFALQSGIPHGILISEGKLLSWSKDESKGIAVTNEGKILSGENDISLTLSLGDNEYPISYVNKWANNDDGISILTYEFFHSSKSTKDRIEIILQTENEYSLLDEKLTCQIADIKESADSEIAKGQLLVSVPSSHDAAKALGEFATGDTVIVQAKAENWKGINFATGVGDNILDQEILSENADTRKTARTAVGIKDDGSIVFFACDGDGDRGLDTTSLAAEMLSIGAKEAYLLASGDYTAVTKGTALVSTPASGEKAVGSSIIFINTNKGNTTAKLSVTPSAPTVLTNGFIDLSCFAADASGKNTGDEVTDIKYSVSSALGTVSGSLFKAGDTAGSVTVTVKGRCKGKELSGSTVINIVDALDNIRSTESTVYVPVGGRARIPVVGTRSDKDVHIYGYKLKWSLSGISETAAEGAVIRCKYGYLDNRMFFHANEGYEGASFTLSAKSGYTTVSVKIVIGKPKEVLNDFDDRNLAFSSYLVLNGNQNFAYTNGKFNTYGMAYSGKSILYREPIKLGYDAKELTLWIKGTAINPYAILQYSNGERHDIAYTCTEDYSGYNGWKKYSLSLPDDSSYVVSPLSSKSNMNCMVDEIEVSYGTASPTFNDISSSWAKDEIEMLYTLDISSGYGTKGNLSYRPNNRITRAEFAKMIVSYYGLKLSDYKDAELKFNDADSIPSWAIPYVKAAVGTGLIGGSANPDGTLSFLPSDYITRAQVATIVGRRITALPDEISFTDRDSIPKYAMEGLGKCVNAGILGGYPDGTFRPSDTITRAEVAKVIANLYKFDF